MAEDAERARRLRILNGLFAKTKENGASEEEATSAMAHAQKLMGDWAIHDYELGEYSAKETHVTRWLNLKYGNKWRWEVANTLSFNVGVYALHYKGGSERIMYYGREQPVEAAALLAEFIIGEIERLAKASHSDLTSQRRFARGCSARVRQRIYEASNLASDPRLPVIMKEQREKASLEYSGEHGEVKNKRSQTRLEDTPEYIAGYRKGDQIKLRKEVEQLR